MPERVERRTRTQNVSPASRQGKRRLLGSLLWGALLHTASWALRYSYTLPRSGKTRGCNAEPGSGVGSSGSP